MNNEIKEILEYLKEIANNEVVPPELGWDEAQEILDYITNLQQENEELKKKIDRRYYKNEYERIKEENEDNLKCIKSLKEQLESVINENQRLLKQWFEDNDKTVKLVSEKECYKQNYNDYKSRCEKAIEYIKENNFHYMNEYALERFRNDLLNILQNGGENK